MKKIILLFALCLAVTAFGDDLSSFFNLEIIHTFERVSGAKMLKDTGKLSAWTEFIYGTATDSAQATTIYTARGTVGSSTPTVYDVASLTGSFGDHIAFTALKMMVVKNLSSGASITIGSGATPLYLNATPAALITIPPDGVWAVCAPLAGLPVGSFSNLRISSASIASYDLVLVGIQ